MQRWRRGVLGVMVATGLVLGPLPGLARAAGPEAAAQDSAPAAVLGLESEDAQHGVALTNALRRAFAKRGLSGGDEANLAELRLALGCEGNDAACLAQGGQTLGARRLVYGSLIRGQGSGWNLEVNLLEVDTGQVERTQLTLNSVDLEAANLDRTAERVAERLAPGASVSDDPDAASGRLVEPPPAMPETEPAPANESGKGKGKVVWGRYEPTPKWKWIGFGTSLGLLTVGMAGTIAGRVWLTTQNGGFRAELLDAAERSLVDSNPVNDVDPNLPEGVNLCDFARSRPVDENGATLGEPGQVRNADVVRVCDKGQRVRKIQTGFAIVAIISGVSTAVFTVLLLTHREPRPASAWRRHRLQVDLGPAPGGGAWLGLRGRM